MKRPPVSGLTVTDHALVRYLERGLGVDVAGLCRRIAARAVIAEAHGAAGVRIDGLTFRLRGGRVVTVLETEARRVRRARRRKRLSAGGAK